MKKLLLPLLTLSLFIACQKEDDDDSEIELDLMVLALEAPDTVYVNEEFTTLVTYGLSDCSYFSRFNKITNEDSTILQVFRKRPAKATCPTVIKESSSTFNYKLSEAGTHYFICNQGENGEIQKAIYVLE